jgi:hypothetical protein
MMQFLDFTRMRMDWIGPIEKGRQRLEQLQAEVASVKTPAIAGGIFSFYHVKESLKIVRTPRLGGGRDSKVRFLCFLGTRQG